MMQLTLATDLPLAHRFPQPRALLRVMASLYLTLAGLVLLGLCILVYYRALLHSVWVLVAPLALLAVNLLAAICSNAGFRARTALLVFHFALLLIIILAALGRLTYLRGHVELSQGEEFNGSLTGLEAGPWHANRLDQVRFLNNGFSIEYGPGVRRGMTRNQVQWIGRDGRMREAEIGDHHPLVIRGYRFYTSFNKGFAPAFNWRPQAGAEVAGTIHLPGFPGNRYRQALRWTPPGAGPGLWTQLVLEEDILPADRSFRFQAPQRHYLVVRRGEERYELRAGDRLTLPEGELQYLGLRTWMGYKVFYDWTRPWLLAACLLAVISLGCHYWTSFRSRSWLH